MDMPSGQVTLLFTDIEGSTKLLHALGDRYAEVLAEHHRLLRDAFAAREGREVDTAGDAFFIAFQQAADAVACAADAQRALSAHAWPEGHHLRVRMGIHTGRPLRTDEGYVGVDLHRAARICAAGHGGQVLLSQSTRDAIDDHVPTGMHFRDLGGHMLKDFLEPERLHQAVIDGLTQDFPPLKTIRPTNLPSDLSTFVGREKEIAELTDLLADQRLVTFTGAGGCGKTRLAIRVATELLDAFPDGVWMIEFASLSDSELVPRAIASVLSIRGETERPIMETMRDVLRAKRLLLIFDNCEHLLDSCAASVAQLLAGCPNMRVLATSREPLGVIGESVHHVSPLAVPPADGAGSTASLAEFESVRLFMERAQASRSEFALDNVTGAIVAQICARLDGIPLALELAASRMQFISAPELVASLDDRFRVLTSGNRSALPRHQTLHAMVSWSFDLLAEHERTLFRRLAVFARGSTLDAISEVCGVAPLTAADVPALVFGLVGKSLLFASSTDFSTRYSMLETIREFAQEELDRSGETGGIRDRHLAWCITFGQTAEREIRWGRADTPWYERLALELGNIRAALRWGESIGWPDGAIQLAADMVEGLWKRGDIAEARTWIESAIRKLEGVAPAVRARSLGRAGFLALVQNEYDQAESLLHRSLREARDSGDDEIVVDALNVLGWMAGERGDVERSGRHFAEGLAISGRLQDTSRMKDLLGNWSSVYVELGRLEEAKSFTERAIALDPERNDWRTLGEIVQLGWILSMSGERRRGLATCRKGLELLRASADKWTLCGALHSVALVLSAGDEKPEAEGLFEEALILEQQYGNITQVARILNDLAQLAAGREDFVRSARLFAAATGLRPGAVPQGQLSGADERQRTLDLVRRALGEEAFAFEWTEGSSMSVDEAVSYAGRGTRERAG